MIKSQTESASHELQVSSTCFTTTFPETSSQIVQSNANQLTAADKAQVASRDATPMTTYSLAQDVLDTCKSWLASMIFHLLLIILLALFYFQSESVQSIQLEIADSLDSQLSQLQGITVDTSSWEKFDRPTEPQNHLPASQLVNFSGDSPLQEFELLASSHGLFDADPIGALNEVFQPALIQNAGLASTTRGTSFFGIEASGDRIVFIVDRSGSMQGSRWQDARGELIASIDKLKPYQEFFVFLFSDSCHPMPRLGGRGKMVPATAENIAETKKWLNRQFPGADTHPLSSVKRALRLEPDTVFLLTDGMFHDRTGQYLLQRAEMMSTTSSPDEVVIHTIAFHCDEGLNMLRAIAITYSGIFRQVNN